MKPADYAPLDPFWKKRGYAPVDGIIATYDWKDIDQPGETTPRDAILDEDALMSRPTTLKVASAQYPIGQPKTLAEWEEKIALWVKNGAATGAELLVFPEYAAIEQAACFGPEVYGDLQRTLAKVAELGGQPGAVSCRPRQKAQRAYPGWIGSGAEVRRTLRQRGAACHAEWRRRRAGKARHDAVRARMGRRRRAVPYASFETTLGKFAIAICYDSEFPLLVRAMAEAGADVVLVPSCTERVSGYHRVRTGSMARALENTIATVQSPTGRRCAVVTGRRFQCRRGGDLRAIGAGCVGHRHARRRNAERRRVGHGNDRPCAANARCAKRARCTTTATGRYSQAYRRRK